MTCSQIWTSAVTRRVVFFSGPRWKVYTEMRSVVVLSRDLCSICRKFNCGRLDGPRYTNRTFKVFSLIPPVISAQIKKDLTCNQLVLVVSGHCQPSCLFLSFESLLSFSWEFFLLFFFVLVLTDNFMDTDVTSMLALVKYTEEEDDRWLGFLSLPQRLFWL